MKTMTNESWISNEIFKWITNHWGKTRQESWIMKVQWFRFHPRTHRSGCIGQLPCAELAESGEPYAFQITFAIRRAWSASRSTNCEKIGAARCPGIGRLFRASLYVNPFDPTAVFCRIRSAGPNVGEKRSYFHNIDPRLYLPFYLVKQRLGLRLFPTVNPATMLDDKKKYL